MIRYTLNNKEKQMIYENYSDDIDYSLIRFGEYDSTAVIEFCKDKKSEYIRKIIIKDVEFKNSLNDLAYEITIMNNLDYFYGEFVKPNISFIISQNELFNFINREYIDIINKILS